MKTLYPLLLLLLLSSTATADWDRWYLMQTDQGTTSLVTAAIQETVKTESDGRVFYQAHVWKREDGFLNEEHLGIYSKSDSSVAPLSFSFVRKYRQTEDQLDGKVDGNKLVVTGTISGRKMPPVRKSLPKGTIFVSLFPYWLSKKTDVPDTAVTAPLKKGVNKWFSFYAVAEDSVDRRFQPMSGRVRAEALDDLARATGTAKYSVEFQGQPSVWYVKPEGYPVRYTFSKTGRTVVEVPEAEARKFTQQ